MINLKPSKTVLIISFAYPPLAAIGSRRVSKISKELLEIGWTPIIVTAAAPKELYTSEIEIPTELVHHVDWFDLWKWINLLEVNFVGRFISKVLKKMIPYTSAGLPEFRRSRWINKAYEEALSITKKHKIDVIYSSFTPPASIRVAYKLNKETKIPWVNEYRDLWTGNPYVKRNYLSEFFNSVLERKLIKNTAALVTVSTLLKEELIKLHNKKTYVVYNGFDEKDTRTSLPSEKEFVISYTGSLYKGVRDPEMLFKAMALLRNSGYEFLDLIKIKFYGPGVPDILRLQILKYKMENFVSTSESVSHEKVVDIQKNSSLLLLLGQNTPSDAGIVTGKFFEYIGRRKNILAITYPYGSVADILEETGLGQVLVSDEAIAEYLKDKVAFFKQMDLHLGGRFNEVAIDIYSRKNQALKLSEVLKSVIK